MAMQPSSMKPGDDGSIMVPEGRRTIATLMEFGLARDLVDRSVSLHERLKRDHGALGRTYLFCLGVMVQAVRWLDDSLDFTNGVYRNVFPRAVVSRTDRAALLVWTHWVRLDDWMGHKIDVPLERLPILRKTCAEVWSDYVENTKPFQWLKEQWHKLTKAQVQLLDACLDDGVPHQADRLRSSHQIQARKDGTPGAGESRKKKRSTAKVSSNAVALMDDSHNSSAQIFSPSSPPILHH